MGYLIATHFVGVEPDYLALRGALPASVEPRIYKHHTHDIWAIDTMRVPQQPNYGFGVSSETRDIPIELPEHLAALQTLYDELSKLKSASGLKRGFVNVSERISGVSRATVLSIYADDDEADLAIVSSDGVVVSVRGRSGDGMIAFSAGGEASLQVVVEDDEAPLHQTAAQVFGEVFGVDGVSIGMSSWDPPKDYGFEEVRGP
ncbi:hypothetical protein [Brevundimonas sp.]|jgi:hypothetical protein|uniref:hypothetical protein n=1 Tax=Brevundimonas sp. TaxID=1871086 RepID=UPI0037BF6ACF